jgi:hypothetical protein
MDSSPATPLATPPQRALVRLGDVTATLTSLTLTPSVDAPSSRHQRSSRLRQGHMPRKLFSVSSPDPADAETAATDDISPASNQPWSDREVRALVAFILLYSEGRSWPSRGSKGDSFWVEAGQYVQKAVNSKYCRSGTACRVRVFKKLCREFRSPIEAEQHYTALDSERAVAQLPAISQRSSSMSPSLPSQQSSLSTSEVMDLCKVSLNHLQLRDQLNVNFIPRL